MKRAHALVMVLCLLFMAGCGSRSINYTMPVHDLKCSSSRTVAVAVVDNRPYVVNQEKPPSYVGLMRGGYGNPFDLWTESRSPLADDLLKSVAESLQARGATVISLTTTPGESMTAILNKYRDAKAERLLLIDLKEWYSDYLPEAYTAERSTLFVEFEVSAYGGKQKKTATSRIKETLDLPSGWPDATVPVVYQQKMRQMLNDSRICGALQ